MPKREQLSLSVIDRVNRQARDAFAYREYRPVTVPLVVCEDEGLALFVQSVNDADDWGCPQGGIEMRESVGSALVRGLRRKISIGPQHFSISAYLGEEDLVAEDARTGVRGFALGDRCFFFAITCTRPDAVVINPSEFSAARWVHPDDFSRVMATTRPAKREMLLRHLRLLS